MFYCDSDVEGTYKKLLEEIEGILLRYKQENTIPIPIPTVTDGNYNDGIKELQKFKCFWNTIWKRCKGNGTNWTGTSGTANGP